MHTKNNDTIHHWLISNRLYEDNLFYYGVIIVFWFFVGSIFMGFEIDGFSQTTNLFFNFIYYLIICICMALCPLWFKLFFSRTHTAKREQALQQALDELDEYDRAEVEAELAHTGSLAMRPAQRWALVFLGSYFLFEVFFISAWVKDLTLVWEPRWATSVIEWVRDNTTLPPMNVDRKLFLLDISSSSDKLLHTMYDSEVEFLDSNFGHSTLLFHFFRALAFFPTLYATYLIFANMIGWSGTNKFKPVPNVSIFAQIKMFLWVSFLTFFMMLIAIGAGKLVVDVEFSAEKSMNIGTWISEFYLNIGFVFVIIFIFLVVSWFAMIKNFVLTLTNLRGYDHE